MASELRVNTLKDASGNNSIATSFVASGSAKAWIDIPAGLGSINASFNVSSLDDDGAGDGGINYTSSMSSATYSIQNTAATGAVDFELYSVSSSINRTNSDSQRAFLTIHGDLA